ncbi:unnamed protein product [Musa banksii]
MAYKFHEDEHGEVIADLCGSPLRAPHGCHAQYMANMGSTASLVSPSQSVSTKTKQVVVISSRKGRSFGAWWCAITPVQCLSLSRLVMPVNFLCTYLGCS